VTDSTATTSEAAGTGARGTGDGAAAEFERLYRANVEAVTAYFARRSANPHVVADLTADTFVTAITSFGSFDPGRGTARAWVFGIARHVFSDQLFDDLMREHGPALANTTPPAHPQRGVTARRTLLAGGATLAVAVAVAGLLVARSGTPAYAVTKNPDGTITLAVYQTSGIAGVNARLGQLGDKQVFVVPVKPGCPRPPAPAVPARGHRITTGTSISPDGSVTVNAQGIPAGDILVIGMENSGHTRLGVGIITSPPAPSCVSAPPPPPGNGGSGS
jgi:Sigma-70 region 2